MEGDLNNNRPETAPEMCLAMQQGDTETGRDLMRRLKEGNLRFHPHSSVSVEIVKWKENI